MFICCLLSVHWWFIRVLTTVISLSIIKRWAYIIDKIMLKQGFNCLAICCLRVCWIFCCYCWQKTFFINFMVFIKLYVFPEICIHKLIYGNCTNHFAMFFINFTHFEFYLLQFLISSFCPVTMYYYNWVTKHSYCLMQKLLAVYFYHIK